MNNGMDTAELEALEQRLGYAFNNRSLLFEALHHSSFVNEHPDGGVPDNERLEFLGDAVLSLAIGHTLMQRYPHLNEGDLSRMRSLLVKGSQLATIAQKIALGDHVRLGKGELLSNGREKKSILADTFEAVVAAVYLDGGFAAAMSLIERHFADQFTSIFRRISRYDYKSQLQELVQPLYKVIPQYHLVEAAGPDHDKTFRVEVAIADITTQGTGKSKKKAEQEAARKALDHFKTLSQAAGAKALKG